MVSELPALQDFMLVDGMVNHGEMIRVWRKEVVGWNSTQSLVNLYNEVLGQDPVSVRWWQRLEKENKIPTDEKRRRVIATILNIPPAYFGLTAFAPLFPRTEHVAAVPVSTIPKNIDIAEYEKDLQSLWSTYYARSNKAIDSIFTKIRILEDSLLYGRVHQKDTLAKVLCEYLILFGNIRRDQGYVSAHVYLDKAVLLAKEKGYDDLQAKALYVRGHYYLDRWELLRHVDRTDLSKALDSFAATQKLVDSSSVSKQVEAALYSEWGVSLIDNAHDDTDRRNALRVLDKAGRIAGASGLQRDQRFLNINTDWYHIDKASAFLALNRPKAALEELMNVAKGSPRKLRRFLTKDIVEARAYAQNGQIEMSVAYAEDALEAANDIQSCRHLTSITTLYERLRANRKYNASPDVARLGVKLLKVYQPALFVN